MHGRGELLRGDPTVKCRAAQRSYSKDFSKSKEGWRYRRAFAIFGMLFRKAA
jgi:hypothetical protein